MSDRRKRSSMRSKKPGGEAIASTLSISEPGNADKIVKSALDAFGRVDILVNNAGILRDRIFHRMSWSDWSDVIAVHLHGSFNMSHACAVHFREQNSGSFVHMTSTSGLVGNFGQANYMAAKLGIVGLSRGIALDMARFNVRSNCIAPFAWTRMIDSIPAETEEEKQRVARFREMTPEKIAPLAVYLGSDRAEGISGQIFLGAQQRDLSVQPDPPDPHAAPLRRLDAGERSTRNSRARSRRLSRRWIVRPMSSRGTRSSRHCRADEGKRNRHDHRLRQAYGARNSAR